MLRRFLAVAFLAATSFVVGCYHEGYGYRVYDPYYSDYHVWGPPEVGYYNQWIVETHRPHREFKQLRPQEQHEYWQWRHNQRERH